MRVCPPEGEMVADAAERVRSALRRIARKHAEQNLVIVAGTVTAALLRCALAGETPGAMWNHVKAPGCWDGHELTPPARKQEQS
jgi:broad specificity phosphatase PhoE